jgi:hypothetical protein
MLFTYIKLFQNVPLMVGIQADELANVEPAERPTAGHVETPLAPVRKTTGAKGGAFCTGWLAPVGHPVHMTFLNRCKRPCFH